MTDDIDGAARLPGERLGHGGDVLELALDLVAAGGAVAGVAAPPAVDGVDRAAEREHRRHDSPRPVVGGRAVDEQQRRPWSVRETRREQRDPRAVRRDDVA